MTRILVVAAFVALSGCGRRDARTAQPRDDGRTADARAAGGAELAIVTEDTRLRRDEPLPATSPLFDGTRVRLRGGRGETLALQVLTRTHDAASSLTFATEPPPTPSTSEAPQSQPAARPPNGPSSAAQNAGTSTPRTLPRAASTTPGTEAPFAKPASPRTSTRAASTAPTTEAPWSTRASPPTQQPLMKAAAPTQRASVSPMQSPTGRAVDVAAVHVDAFAVQWLNLREPSTTMYGPSRGAGVYPDPLRPSSQPVTGDALFDVAIAADAAPGLHRGTLIVGTRTFPVELTVEAVQVAVDEEPLVWIWYMPAEIARAHGLPDDDRALLPLEERYHALARAHGAYLASDLPLDRFVARQALMRGTRYWPVEIDLSTVASAQHDVQQWLNQFATRAQTAFTIPIDEPHSAAERASARAAGERIGRHDKLLRAVTAPPNRDFGDAIDVFIGPASRPPHRWTYNGTPPAAGSMVIDAAGPSLRTWGWIAARYGVELWYAWEGTYFADRYNGGGPTDVLTDPLTYDQRRKRLRNPDWGNGDGVLFYPPPQGASPQAPGDTSSSVAAATDPKSSIGVTNPSASSDRSGAPSKVRSNDAEPAHAAQAQTVRASAEAAAVDGPWPSLRLKTLRRGLQDRLLLRALEQCGAADVAAALLRELVPRALDEGAGAAAWPEDPAAWEAARGRLYDAWRARCGGPHG